MELLGTIQARDDATAERDAWVTLISAHSFLASVAPREGISPLHRQPLTLKPRPDCARIMLDGNEVGMIEWAQDDSDRLIVWASHIAKIHAASVAIDIAARLGMRYFPDETA